MRQRFIIIFGIVLSLFLGLLLTVHVIARGIHGPESFGTAAASPQFGSVLLVNVLIGGAIGLFVLQSGRGTWRVVLTVAAALVIGFGIMLLITPQPLVAYNALLTGPLSLQRRWGSWLDDALSLMIVGLAITVVFRAQLFSLGAEGQLYLGALAAGLVALFVTGLPPLLHLGLAVLAACITGMLWSLIPGLLRAYLDANELVASLMLNQVGILLYGMAIERLRPKGASSNASAFFPESALFTPIVSDTRVTTALFVVVLAVGLVWLLIRRTPLGFEIRMLGSNPNFARYGGINVKQTVVRAMAISGILGGLTGAYMALAIHRRLPQSVTSGLTFEGIVVALLARNDPLAVPAMALLYAYLRAGAPIMQSDAGVSLEIVRVIQAVIILLFTAEGLVNLFRARRKRSAVPAQPM